MRILVRTVASSSVRKMEEGTAYVFTSKNQKPNMDWLGWVVSSKARSKIKQAISMQEQSSVADGKELLSRRLKNWKLELPDDMLTELRKKLGISTLNAFYAAVGNGTLDVNDIKDFILGEEKRRQEAIEAAQAAEEARNRVMPNESKEDILVLNARDVKGLDYRMARCCNPVFGDDVFGFVTRGEGIKIHRITCPNASRLLTMFPYRIQKVRWSDAPSGGGFQATLKIIADQEGAVVNKIMEVTSAFKASVRSFSVSENPRHGTQEISMKVLVPSTAELDKVVSQIRLIKSVIKVSRL